MKLMFDRQHAQAQADAKAKRKEIHQQKKKECQLRIQQQIWANKKSEEQEASINSDSK
jgi:hypothetical protein